MYKHHLGEQIKYFDYDGNELLARNLFINNKLYTSYNGEKWGFIDKNDNTVVECKYDRVTEFNEYGFAGICENNKWGVIDENGNIVQEPIYKIDETNSEPEFLGKYYKVYYGYGESYYTNNIEE